MAHNMYKIVSELASGVLMISEFHLRQKVYERITINSAVFLFLTKNAICIVVMH